MRHVAASLHVGRKKPVQSDVKPPFNFLSTRFECSQNGEYPSKDSTFSTPPCGNVSTSLRKSKFSYLNSANTCTATFRDAFSPRVMVVRSHSFKFIFKKHCRLVIHHRNFWIFVSEKREASDFTHLDSVEFATVCYQTGDPNNITNVKEAIPICRMRFHEKPVQKKGYAIPSPT